jgi:beta-lactam-binding protein with PASTA domain/predicted Ser/Thr protein kinase
MTMPRLLGSRYEIGEVLGYGGMAEVHLGRDVRLGREVAVKVLRADLARDPSFQTRFRREAQAAASLNHPAIVAVYDTGEDAVQNGGLPYIVMEYVEGRTVRDILKAEGRLMPRRAMEIVADVCAALDFSHRNGIVHRDVKPGNVMITPTGAVKVMDFGIARAAADAGATVTATAQVIGTAQYLSPEQARGENVDARSDVYSTGCMLYELLTGHPPFTGDSPVAVAYQHVREIAPPPSSSNPDVPPDLDAIVMKSMAKNPANRYQTANEMRSDLIRAINGRPVAAEPVLSDEERTVVLGGPAGLAAPGGGYPTQYGTRGPDAPRRRTWGWVALGVAVLLVFVLAAFVTSKMLANNDDASTVAVPSLSGKTRAQADAALAQAKLKGNYIPTVSSPDQNGRVLDTSPAAGSTVKPDSTVDIKIGSGPATISVPDVTQISFEDANTQLKAAKLGVKRNNVDSDQPAGQVLDQNPKANARVAVGTVVTLSVSNGKVEIPDVTGKSLADAHRILNLKGFFNIVDQKQAPPDDFEPGTVFNQSPVGGSRAGTDQQITLSVAGERPASSPPPSTPPSTSPSTAPSTPPTGSSPPTGPTPPTGGSSPPGGIPITP